jgi:hypothetical protein
MPSSGKTVTKSANLAFLAKTGKTVIGYEILLYSGNLRE